MEVKPKILELFSGIGGMHCAFTESDLPGKVILAVDVNIVANGVYAHNFPDTNISNRNIQSLKSTELNKLGINTILMSPPCQPFTRNGKFLDKNDPRTCSFLHIIDMMEELVNIEYILMENVKGFECSNVRDMFIEKLQKCNFIYQEFLLCPSSVGVPNSRLRYYCIARRTKHDWRFNRTNEIMCSLPSEYPIPFSLKEILQDVSDEYLVPNRLLKWAKVFDICYEDSNRSCCFTKSYTHYVDGTGSVFTNADRNTVKTVLEEAMKHPLGSEEYIKIVKTLKFRYFTPKEVSLLMSFPENYTFPEATTRKQCYRLLGNSVNVKVISELIKILFLYILIYIYSMED